ncbi:hypothetical protein PRZ48_009129 [Zasmidium cellare]|uniref:Uncharacterized protein n=1 Tax=Zasmidium cellare TaxID=395010 RepID=A0ABR0EHI3_ZASCE|nr:hypothetical protein PRZ48_009129 [Zasmidium cellare]
MSPRWWQSQQADNKIIWSKGFGLLSIALFAIIGAFTVLQHTYQYAVKSTDIVKASCSCGASPQEAMARGCRFDQLAMAWLPPHCRDDELMDMLDNMQTEQNHTWTYYTHPDAEEQLSAEQVSLLAGDPDRSPDLVVTTMDWHHSHCLSILWKKARSRQTNVIVEGRYAEEKRDMHCIKSVLEFIASSPGAAELLAVSQVDLYPD